MRHCIDFVADSNPDCELSEIYLSDIYAEDEFTRRGDCVIIQPKDDAVSCTSLRSFGN